MLHRGPQQRIGLASLLDLAQTSGLQTFQDALVDGTFPVEDAPEAFELAVAAASVTEPIPEAEDLTRKG